MTRFNMVHTLDAGLRRCLNRVDGPDSAQAHEALELLLSEEFRPAFDGPNIRLAVAP